MNEISDPYIQANVLTGLHPQQVMWCAMHQDVSSDYVWDKVINESIPSSTRAGEMLVKHLLKGQKHHWGPTEQWGIVIALGYIPHSVMQQLRTHRIGFTADCQSFRWTFHGLTQAYEKASQPGLSQEEMIEILDQVFYLRQPGTYRDRDGRKVEYTEAMRVQDMSIVYDLLGHYYNRVIEYKTPPEMARGLLPFDYRQHLVVGFNNVRSLLHVCDMRIKGDAQGESAYVMKKIFDAVKAREDLCPEILEWYEKERLGKGLLAP